MKHCLPLLFFGWISAGFQPASGNLEVELKDLKTGKGKLYISLFSKENGFPENPDKAFKTWILSTESKLDLGALPTGTYALALLHDLDGNKKMTYNILGIPQDGYSISPDGGPKWSKPAFSKSTFSIEPGQNQLTLKVHY